jgi:choline monooxygenase
MTVTSPDLARASTLPSRFYFDPAVLEQEKDRVFGRTWQLVARLDDLARPGDFVPAAILDEPLIITHGMDGVLRGFYNVCRHRAGQVALSKGNRKSLQCRYHGWTYGLDGALRACPEMEETEDFRKADFGLVPVRVEHWGPFVFANLDEAAPPLREVMGAIPDEVAATGYDVEHMRLVERRDYVVECNWKVYVDNYLEGYHLPIAHPALFRELDYDSYRVETFRYYSKQHAPIRDLRPGRGARSRPALRPHTGRRGRCAVLLALPEHDVQHLPGQHVVERHPAAGPGADVDHLRVVLRRARHGQRLGVDAADDRLL